MSSLKNITLLSFIFFGVALLTLFFFAAPAQAQDLGIVQQYSGCSGTDCGTCNVVKLANGVIMWLIGFVFILFALLLARAGIKLVISGGNPSALQNAKDNFVNSLIGLLIILASWLIVDTMMRALVGGPGNEGQLATEVIDGERTGYLLWSQIECTAQVTPDEVDEFTEITLDPLVAGGTIGSFPLDATNNAFIPALPPQPAGQVCYPGNGSGPACFPVVTGIAGTPGYNYPSGFPVPPYWIDTQSLPGAGLDTKVSPNYTLRQLNVSSRCGNGGRYLYVSPVALQRVEQMNLALNTRLPFNSVHRSPACNTSVGGSATSMHMSGLAFDMGSDAVGRCAIIQACRAQGAAFINTYTTTTHVHCDWGNPRGESLTISCP